MIVFHIIAVLSVVILFISCIVIAFTEKYIPIWIRIILPLLTFPLVLAVLDSIYRNL